MKKRSSAFLNRKKAKNTSRISWGRVLNSSYFRMGVIGLTFATGLLYVLQMNVTATKGYDIRELEQSIVELKDHNKKLELDSMELQSLARVVNQLPTHYLVDATPDSYVSTAVATFASR